MPDAQAVESRTESPPAVAPASPDLTDYPVREYIAALSAELARMARWDGDEALACALEAASALAERPAP